MLPPNLTFLILRVLGNTYLVVALLGLASIGILVALVLLSWAANKEKITERTSVATCAIVAALTCSSIQTLTVLSNLEVCGQRPQQEMLGCPKKSEKSTRP